MKSCSISLFTLKWQIKTTGMAIIIKINKTKYWQGCRPIGNFIASWRRKCYNPWGKCFTGPYKVKHILTLKASSSTCISTREMKIHIHEEICKRIFTDFFLIGKNWKLPKDPLKRMNILYIMWYYSGI